MNLSKQALILTISLVGLANMNYTGLQPAQAEKPATQGQQQSKKAEAQTRQQQQKENHQTKPKPNQSTDGKPQQKPESTKENHARNGEKNQLNLTDTQKAQIQQIHQQTRQRINAVYTPEQQELIRTAKPHQRVNLKLSADQKAKIQAIHQDAKRLRQGILTPEQQKLQGQHSSEGKRQQASTKSASQKR